MTSNTSLYGYSATGNATIPSNNNTSLYNPGGGNAIPINGNVTANNINVSNNVTVGGQVSVVGNIITDSYFIGDGGLLSNISSSYGNANVAAFLPTYTGNLAGDNLSLQGAAAVTGNITTGGYLFGNGSQLTGVATSYGNANVAAFLPTYTGNLAGGNLTVSGKITGANINSTGGITAQTDIGTYASFRTLGAQGNIVGPNYVSANYFVGDGSQLTNISGLGYSNANVIALGETGWSGNIIPSANAVYNLGSPTRQWNHGYFAANTIYIGGVPLETSDNVLVVNNSNVITSTSNSSISTTGNISAVAYVGDGSQLTNVTANVANNVIISNINSYSPSLYYPTWVTSVGAQQLNVDDSGAIMFYAPTTATLTTGALSTYGITVSGNITTINSGNITASYYFGDGSQLTNVSGTGYSNANVAAFLPVYGGTILANLINFTNNSGVIEQGADRLTITGNASQVNTGGYFNDTGEAAIFANSYVAIATNTTANVNPTWTFGADGNMTAPGDISTAGNVETGNIIVADDRVIYASHGYYGPPDATFAPVRVGLYGPNPNYAIGVESNHSWIQGQNGVKLYDGSGVTLVANAAGITGANILTSGEVTATGNINGSSFVGNRVDVPSGSSNIGGFVINANQIDGLNSSGVVEIIQTTDSGNPQPEVKLRAAEANNSLYTTVDLIKTQVAISTWETGVGGHQWSFDNTGNLTFPDNTVQTTAYTGGGSSYGNANVVTLLADFGANTISTTGNITGNYFIGNGSQLTGITSTASDSISPFLLMGG